LNEGPKRPISAYFYYMQAERESYKSEHPDSTFGEQTKAMAEIWKELDGDVKAKYTDLAATDKARYTEEKAAWDEAHPAAAKEPKAGKKKKKKKKKKPRAPNAFNLYMSAELAKAKAAQPELTHKDAFAKVGAAWKSLSEEELAGWKEVSNPHLILTSSSPNPHPILTSSS